MNNLISIAQRVAVWNSRRYDQLYNHELALRLLREEYTEWLEADQPVDKLDALCDVIFVAFGAAWKADLNIEALDKGMEQSIDVMLNLVDNLEVNPIYLVATLLDVMEHDNETPLESSLTKIITCCLTQGMGMGLTPMQMLAAVEVVCDSNDSKSIKGKVAANVKANDKDKGAYFVPPEPRLQLILDKAVSFN